MADSKKTTLKEQATIKKIPSPQMRSSLRQQQPQQSPKPMNNEKDLIKLLTTYLTNVTKEGDNEQLELEVIVIHLVTNIIML